MELHVSDLMSTNVVSFSSALGLDALEQELTLHGVSGGPVIDGKGVLGVVSHSDIIRQLNIEQTNVLMAYDYYETPYIYSYDKINLEHFGAMVGERMASLTVADIMNPSIISVMPDQTLTDAADLMLEKNIHRLLVVDTAILVGLISSFDFVKLYSRKRH